MNSSLLLESLHSRSFTALGMFFSIVGGWFDLLLMYSRLVFGLV